MLPRNLAGSSALLLLLALAPLSAACSDDANSDGEGGQDPDVEPPPDTEPDPQTQKCPVPTQGPTIHRAGAIESDSERSIEVGGSWQGHPSGVHASVGAMRDESDAEGRNIVSFIPSGSKIFDAAN